MYITTPIFYVNDKPHIGHAYTTVLADIIARYHRLNNKKTLFLTGTDEHGQKVAQSAARNGLSPQEQCSRTVIRFQRLWKELDISYDDFIRTTEVRHKQVVQRILSDLYEQGEIYKDNYKGLYCVPCERFYTEKDIINGKCPQCKRNVEPIVESNYFFRIGKYQEWLINYINTHPGFIQPDFRRNETLGFLRQVLGDLCISRPKSRMNWGIELPFDQDYVCYVWFDALINYISALSYQDDMAYLQRWWPADYHLIGKDILTTHSVYWPIMLKAIGLPMPRCIFAHGWWLIGRDKMGKSTGNAVEPMTLCAKYGVDAFRYFLAVAMSPGHDTTFSEDALIKCYNTDLAGGLGNMLSRILRLLIRDCHGKIPAPGIYNMDDHALQETCFKAVKKMQLAMNKLEIDRGLAAITAVIRTGNRYLETNAPWHLAKQDDFDRLHTVLYISFEVLRIVSILLYPVIPAKMSELQQIIGIKKSTLDSAFKNLEWGGLRVGQTIKQTAPLFPRLEP